MQESTEVPNLQTKLNYLDLLRFYCILVIWTPCSSEWRGRGWGMGVPPHAHMHMCMHAHTCTCSYPKIYMYRNCKWLPSCLCLACLTCACVCMHVGVPHTPRYPLLPPPGLKGAQITKNVIKIEIIQFCLQIWNMQRFPHPFLHVVPIVPTVSMHPHLPPPPGGTSQIQ